jgi:WD40 repeat protein
MYLWDLQGNLIKTLFTEDIVRAIDFSPEGKTILTGMQKGVLALYDLDGNIVQSFEGHTKSINAVSFSPDGTKILSGSKDKSVILWNLKGEKLHVYKNHTKEISSVCFSPDGKKILSGSLDNTACIYHTSGQLIKQLKEHKMAVNSVAFSPDGTKILTCSDDHSAILWDINGHIIHRFDQHESTVLDVTFSPDSRHFLSSTDSRNIYLWNLSGELINEFKGHTKDVIKTCFHPGNNMFFSGSYDHTIRTWKLKENENRILKGQQKWITSTDVSKNSELILSASNDGKIVLYDKAGNVVRIIKRRGRKISFASFDDNDQKILAGYDNGWIEVCNLTGEKILEIKGHKDRINSIDFSPKRGFILSGSEDGWVCVWDTSGNLIFRGPSNLSVYSPEEESLIAVIGNGGALFDLNRNVLAYYRGHQDKINDIDFSPDGELIATGSYDKTMRIWDIKGNTLQIIKHDAVINSLCFSPDGKFILTGASDNKARLWDLNGNLRQVFTGHTMPISSVNFFPDGNDVLTGSHDNTVRIWNVKKTYKAFKNQFNYSKLTIQDKLNYGILNFETLYETTNEKALLEGADFYIEKHTTQPDTKDPYQYLDKARELAEKLLQINKNKALYYTKLYDIMSYYDNKKVDFNVEQKMNDIFTAILFLPEKERANASEYFYLYFNDLSIKLLESFQDSNLKKNYSQRLFTSYNNYALELLRNGQYKEALKFAKKGCKYKPDEGIIYTKLVLAYLYNDQYEKAKKILENHRYEIVNDVLFQEYILIRLKEFETFYELPPDYEKVRKLLNEDETTV